MVQVNNLITSTLFYLLIVASVIWVSIIVYLNPMLYAENVDRYWSVLTGDSQVPPVNTAAVGYIGLKFSEDSSKLVFIVNVDNIDNITGVNLYQANKTQKGVVILDLLNAEREHKSNDAKIVNVKKYEIEGTLTVGGVTSNDLQGQLQGKSLSDLHKLMTDGRLYVSIETKEFPNGEIRGDEFIPVDRVFPDVSDVQWK